MEIFWHSLTYTGIPSSPCFVVVPHVEVVFSHVTVVSKECHVAVGFLMIILENDVISSCHVALDRNNPLHSGPQGRVVQRQESKI